MPVIAGVMRNVLFRVRVEMEIIYSLSTKQIDDLHKLYENEWWTNNRSFEETKACVEGSQICIGLVNEKKQLVGFARVLTDYIFKALIFDVIVSDEYRGNGLGDKLMSLIKKHPKLDKVKCFELYCLPEMFPYYRRHGFSEKVGEIKLMKWASA